jgi:hypothetical protein
MLLIKLSADEIRRIKAGGPGALELVTGAIERAETLRLFGRSETLKRPSAHITWQRAHRLAADVLGRENVRMPPFPDKAWYIKLATALRGREEPWVTSVATHCKERLRMPISLDFLISQGDRILNGEFDHQTTQRADVTACKLPE